MKYLRSNTKVTQHAYIRDEKKMSKRIRNYYKSQERENNFDKRMML